MTAYRSATPELDEAIRRALAAVAEQRRLAPLRAQRWADLQVARARVEACADELAVEERDVARVRDGAWARVASVFVDRSERVADEVMEASAAAARLAEAQAVIAPLEAEIADLDRQLAALGDAEAALHAARQAKLEALLATDDPVAVELLALVSAIADAEAALRRLAAQLTAGAHLELAVRALVDHVDRAEAALRAERGQQGSPGLTRERISAVRGALEAVEHAWGVYQPGLAAHGVALDAPYLAVDGLRPDGWLQRLFTDARAEALATLRAEGDRFTYAVGTAQHALSERRLAVAQRLADLRAQRDAHLAPA